MSSEGSFLVHVCLNSNKIRQDKTVHAAARSSRKFFKRVPGKVLLSLVGLRRPERGNKV